MTKREAIDGHRKMWRWIVEQIEGRQVALKIEELKWQYCLEHDLNLFAHCFCCEYIVKHAYPCSACPLEWPDADHKCNVLYWSGIQEKNWEKQASIARKIAELPERE